MSPSSACLEALKTFFIQEPGILHWGITLSGPARSATRLENWIQKGFHAGMGYMAANLEKRLDPGAYQSWAQSMVLFSLAYPAQMMSGSLPGAEGYKVAAYAQGKDYHFLGRNILNRLENHLKHFPALENIRFSAFTDTAPVFERDFAAEAGLGWRAKNSCTLNRQYGSGFCLAGCFLDVELPPTEPLDAFCGGCTLCLDHCPTQAFESPGLLNSAKCISYWTIEAKGEIPASIGDQMGSWIFGCDICQAVCPWNKKHLSQEPPSSSAFHLSGLEWLRLLRRGGGFRSRFKQTPLMRAGRKSLLRNLAIVARNLEDRTVLPLLKEVEAEESEPVLLAEIRRSIDFLSQ